MVEKTIERILAAQAKAAGGWAPKFTSPGTGGMPDRILLFPGGKIAFVEVKAPGQRPRPLQLMRHRALMDMGFKVFVLDGIDQIPGIIMEAMR